MKSTKLNIFFENHTGLIINLSLFIIPLTIYWQTINFNLIWDDTLLYFGKIPVLTNLGLGTITDHWTNTYLGVYTPIMTTFWAVLWAIGGLVSSTQVSHHAAVLHLADIFLHIVNGFLVFRILSIILKHKWAALMGALIFLVHPIQSQAAAWITGTREVLSTFFCFSSIIVYLKGGRLTDSGEKGSVKNIILCLFLFILALLTKPSSISAALIIAALEIFYFKESIKVMLKNSAPWFLISFIWALTVLPILITQEYGGIPYSNPLWSRPFILMDDINFYLYKIFFPLSLAPSYARVPKHLITQWWLYLEWIIPAIIFFELWSFRKKHPLLITSFIIFIMGFLPMSGLISFTHHIIWSTISDRYIYMSMLGFSLAFAYSLTLIKKTGLWIMPAVLILVLALRSFAVQVPIWKNEFTLWDHCIMVTPDDANAYYNRGLHYQQIGNAAEALKDFSSALKINPDMEKALMNRAVIYINSGLYTKAFIDLDNAIKINPGSSEAFYNRGYLFGKTAQPDLALKDYNQALMLDPKNIEAHKNRGALFADLKRYDDALNDFNTALTIEPGNPVIMYDRGNLYLKLKKYDLALNDYSIAIDKDPKLWQAVFNRSGIFRIKKDYKKALIDINHVIEINPNHPRAQIIRKELVKYTQ